MGIIRRPDPVKLADADTPAEEVVCIIEKSNDGKTVEILCLPEELLLKEVTEEVKEVRVEPKPKAVISSTATGEQFGSWIPSLHSTGILDVNVKNAFYTKTGRLITCTFDIVVTNMSAGTSESPITLRGLPVNSITSPGTAGSAHISYFKTPSNELQQVSGTIRGNDNQIELWCYRHGRKGLFPLTQFDININTVLVGTVTYITNS